MVYIRPPNEFPTKSYTCDRCGATASTLVGCLDSRGRAGWYCLLCAPERLPDDRPRPEPKKPAAPEGA